MKKVIILSIFVAFLLQIIQTVILFHFSLFNALPDLTLLFVLYISLYNGSFIGIWVGFFAGFSLDFLSICPFGLHAFIFTVIAYIFGKLQGRYNEQKIFIPMLLGFFGTLIKLLLYLLLHVFFGKSIQIYSLSDFQFWSELLLNVVFAPILFFIFNLFHSVFVLKEF